MRQKKNANSLTVTIVKNGLPKQVTVTTEIAKVLETAYEESRVYGLGGSTARKLMDFFERELDEFARLNKEYPEATKAGNFAAAFRIASNEAPLLLEAILWVEKHKDDEGFSSRMITLDTLLMDEVLGYRIPVQYNPYVLMVQDFEAWAGKCLAEAQLNVSFVRFVKFFYSVIK